jgi:hypothetical protein
MITLHHLVVDRITTVYGTKGQTTVRVDDKSGLAIKMAKYYYGFYQFTALGSHLIPSSRLHEMGFNTLIAIQSSAFLMTLFRKGLINWYSHAAWYTACLMLSQYHMSTVFDIWWLGKIVLCFLARTKLRMNKYLIWSIFCLVSSPWGQAVWTQQTLNYDMYKDFAANSFDREFWLAQKANAFSFGDSMGVSLDSPIFDFTLTWRVVMGFGLLFMGFERRANLPAVPAIPAMPTMSDIRDYKDNMLEYRDSVLASVPEMPQMSNMVPKMRLNGYSFWGAPKGPTDIATPQAASDTRVKSED